MKFLVDSIKHLGVIVYIAVFYNSRFVNAGFFDSIYYNYISVTERCDDKWVSPNMLSLKNDLNKYVYGQPFIDKLIIPFLTIHLASTYQPRKPLAFSFHGSPGTGKNYVADFIVRNIYKEGTGSKFKKQYNGRLDFPLDSEVDVYKVRLQMDIRRQVENCPTSVFVFDEIDKIPEGILDAIKPFLDYNTHIADVDYRRSIFIFLSNIGSQAIIHESDNLRGKGLERKDFPYKNYESKLMKWTYNEKGGLRQSSLITNFLIDAYVPFLPLEREHVVKCIKDVSENFGIKTTGELIDEVVSQLSFGPEPDQIYSTTGCKNIESKVLIYDNEHNKYFKDEF